MNLDELDAVIFDFGGVFINLNYNDTIAAFKKLGIDDFNTLYSQANQSGLFDQFETGKISSQRFINELLHLLPSGTSPNAVVIAWNAMLKNVPYEGIELLKSLRKNTHLQLFMLSNTNDIHIELALRRWKEVSNETPFDIFNKVYLSQEIQLRKPDPEVFELVYKEQGFRKERTLFIDDSLQHIVAAGNVGLKTHHITEINQLYQLFS